MCVWASQNPDLVEAINSIREPDAKRWVFAVMDTIPSSEFTQVLVTLWAIW